VQPETPDLHRIVPPEQWARIVSVLRTLAADNPGEIRECRWCGGGRNYNHATFTPTGGYDHRAGCPWIAAVALVAEIGGGDEH